MAEPEPIFREHNLLEAEIKIPWTDRIRLIFGSRLYVHTEIHTQWRGEIKAKSTFNIERVFLPLKKKPEATSGPA